MKEEYEISQIITGFRAAFIEKYHPPASHLKVLTTLEQCRTSVLGGHIDVCPDCGSIKISYNSCRNRHCPKCQGFEREKWVMARKEDILPVKYFHVVFTLPATLHPLCLSNKEAAYGALFHAAWGTLSLFASKEEIQTGAVAILHTWNTQLGYHPHLHLIVAAGGITKEGTWKDFPNASNNSEFLFPVKAMSKVFRAKYTAILDKKQLKIDPGVRKELYKKKWVVYCKRPFCQIEKTVEYFGRYSHRVAITNRRIKLIDNHKVTFEYKDRQDGGRNKIMSVDGEDFLHLFCRHILPEKTVRIRHYGFLAPSNKAKLNQLQQQFLVPCSPRKRKKVKWMDVCEQITGSKYLQCPCCKSAQMLRLHTLLPDNHRRPPPFTGTPDFDDFCMLPA